MRHNLQASYENLMQNHLGGSDNFYYQESRLGTYKGIEMRMLATGVYALGKHVAKRGAQFAMKQFSKGLKFETYSSTEFAIKNSTRLNKLASYPEALDQARSKRVYLMVLFGFAIVGILGDLGVVE
ncbi:unknown protein [Simkania negevensis Z]|uniref:Uncharacterized protein n=2 Tax=Simkania negevensis TaxID=83561 RepID=F8L512_SIMNZ|nr:unknown protein [Simkania negevensis Z]